MSTNAFNFSSFKFYRDFVHNNYLRKLVNSSDNRLIHKRRLKINSAIELN